MKKEKYLSLTNYVFSGSIIISLGIAIIIGSQGLYKSVITFLVYIFLLLGISQFITVLIKSKKEVKKEKLIVAGCNIIFAIIMMMFPNIPLSIIPLLFAIYLLLNCAVKSINYYLMYKNKLPSKWKELFLAIFFFIVGISFLFSPLGHLPTILSIIGGYCILLGLGEFKELLQEVLSPKSKKKLKRTFRITLPVFLEAFLPRKMLYDINRYFNDMKELNEADYEQEKEDIEPDLEIFIHVSPQGFNQFGHMDIYFEGKVISYGNYDKSSIHFFESIGDGVLFESEKEKYIPFVIKHSNKTLIGFGLKLTNKQKEMIKKELIRIKSDVYEWLPIAKIDRQNNVQKKVSEYDDYASVLYLETKENTTFFKFKRGEFKTYFVLGSNCTLFADKVIGKSGTDLLKMVGLITPGSYLDYLEHEFCKKNSIVIRKTIYNEVTKEQAILKNKKKTLKKKKSMIK